MENIRIATRKSPLALKQVEEICSLLNIQKYEIVGLDSQGDIDKKSSLMSSIADDFFTKNINQALLDGRADLAVHSAKDLPRTISKELELIYLSPRKNPKDSLVSIEGLILADLPMGARVGTSSSSRKEQLLKVRPDLEIVSIRGTIGERISLLETEKLDAIIVATCALERLNIASNPGPNLDREHELDFHTHPLQGYLAVVVNRNFHKNLEKTSLRTRMIELDEKRKWGKVILAGAGPGDPKLVTLELLNALGSAEVIFYDALVNPLILHHSEAEKIYVGKKKGQHSKSQEEIIDLLIQYARKGKTVLRLKGGDPMLFGRGSEEASKLDEALIKYSIIPGISAAFGAASYTGIPLTERGSSSNVSFLTGYPLEKVKIPDTDTLVYYMGNNNASKIAQMALDKGMDTNCPTALVKNATYWNQEVCIQPLDQLTKYVPEDDDPVLLIIGSVVDRYDPGSWFTNQKRVLYTGTELPELNWESAKNQSNRIVHQALIQLSQLKIDYRALAERIKEYDYLIFTSKYAVAYFMTGLKMEKKDARILSDLSVVSIGKRTSVELAKWGLLPDLQSEEESSDGIVSLFGSKGITGAKILIPCSDLALAHIKNGLEALGNLVDKIAIYSNTMPENLEKMDLQKIDRIVFTSPSTVINFQALYGHLPKHLEIQVRGKATRELLEELFPDAQEQIL